MSIARSRDYDPEPNLASIKAQVFALNFSDDEFNPKERQRGNLAANAADTGKYGICRPIIGTYPRHQYNHHQEDPGDSLVGVGSWNFDSAVAAKQVTLLVIHTQSRVTADLSAEADVFRRAR